MTDVGFYHLTRASLLEALPPLLTRTLATGQRALVLGSTAAQLDTLSAALWAHPAWLPHGTVDDGDPDLQPIWLSTQAEPLNGARFLFLIEGSDASGLHDYDRVFDLFDGNNADAVAAARARWKTASGAGHAMTYWQQTETGWHKKP